MSKIAKSKAIAAQPAISSEDIDMNVPDVSDVSDVPTASAVESEAEVPSITFAQLKDYLPHLTVEDLLDTLDAVHALIRKHLKKGKGKVKAPTGPKKPAPPTLARNQGWIRFVQEYVSNNGWESFEINQTTDGVKELIERSGSIPNDQQPPYTYKDTKTGQTIQPAYVFEDTQKHLIYKEAMSLAALLKWEDGKKPAKAEDEEANWSDLYRQFLETYEEADAADAAIAAPSSSSTPDSTSVRRLTAAEREQERLEKQRIKDEAKEEKKREKEAEKARKTAEKEAEKAKKAAEKAEKAKKAEKVKKVPTPPALPAMPLLPAMPSLPALPAKAAVAVAKPAVAKPAVAAVAAVAVAPVKKTILAKPTQPKKPEPEVMTWNIPDDGMIHPWTFQGKRYVVNAQYCCWEATDEDEAGDWVGLVIPEENRIEDSIDEPDYEEDE